MSDRQDRRRERFGDAALEAEYETGQRESTPGRAKHNIVLRIVLITVGTIITLAGLAALVLPGPGIVLILIGLGILAQEVSWAERLLAYAKRKAKIDKVKTQPTWVRVLIWIFTILGIGAGVAFAVSAMSD
ncbi:MAG: PGPGW domain-containing protein [Acidimicrobiia bacterium]|nr:PGPGW domain-containing protein [Acidimicrobiia bacterium]